MWPGPQASDAPSAEPNWLLSALIRRSARGNLLAGKLPLFSEWGLKDSLEGAHTLNVMWIDDSSADVIKADFEALYHGDMLVEGETAEQFEEQLDGFQSLPTAS